ncbi:MAG TPA: DUF3027 domain-containing protein, partial [Mycobacterium sp.]|nr:DUF3027 domain-containing protein [Mycobacterium sp.]
PDLDELGGEVGFGRRQVLSQWGRIEAAQRWHDSDFGPESAMARATRRVCRDCGFYLPLTGSLGTAFGVCTNEMSADGRVVADEYGCGAHSETPAPAGIGSPIFDPYDDGVVEVTDVVQVAVVDEVTESEEPTEPVDAEEPPAEPAEATEAVDTAEPVEPVEPAEVTDATEPEPAEATAPEEAPEPEN